VNLAERFDAHEADHPALVTKEGVVTYGELADRAGAWHGGLIEAGLVPGERILIIAGNSEVFVTAYLCCLSAGLISVPVNPNSPAAELRREIDLVTPSAVIVDDVGAEVWQELDLDRPATIRHAFVSDGGKIETLDSAAQKTVVSVDGKLPAVLLFTSGTAGASRAAILSHDNLWASMRAVTSLPLPLKGEGHVVLAVIPLFHVFGLNLIINLSLTIGATLVVEDHVSAERTAELTRENSVTILGGPPSLWASLLAATELAPADFASVRLAVSGAAPLNPRVAVGIKDKLGIQIGEGYGLTETSGICTSAIAHEAPLGSVGRMFPGVEVRLVGEAGEDVLIGDPGEIWIRGPMVSPGYWEDQEATERTRNEDGWLKTGDVGVVDDKGNVSVIDRIKDLVLVSGFNVHPAEVEMALTGHPSVEAAGVAGTPDPVTGERVVAHVVLRDQNEGTEDDLRNELIAHCRKELARYKVPKEIRFTDSLPTGLVGKLRRVELNQSEG